MDGKDTAAKKLERRCTELEKQVKYYKEIAEKTGQKRLREVEQLNRLISERRKSEKALRESEQRFRLIAKSTNDIFYERDTTNGELKWFGDIDSALGYDIGEIKHTLADWLRLIHPKDRSSHDETVLRYKKSASRIFRAICKDGEIKYFSENSSPVLNQEGKPTKWVGGISDITEQKKAEKALIQAQRLSAIGELASGVAHDFKNSLQGIFGNIELALQSDLSSGVRDYLYAAKRSATDAASRIRQLQRFSRKEKSRIVNERLNLNSILDDIISQTKPLWEYEAEKAGIVITIEKNYAEKELNVNGNAGELRSLLYNLIKNSVQAMPEGGRLAFETGKTENGVKVIVTDTGTGMDEATKAKIFQPFFTTKDFKQGIGLGMSTSYAIVKEHGGEIYVKNSAPGKGTSIEVMLPYLKKNQMTCS
ncbi:MAG: hypothetical protein B6I22_13595 [Desulfobacteraceae bacterium 4572_123]|nr:MAG: hypothetical protein B6I22_13595 [Desulfobacteraceae bacterium 4572_123]